jgi:hypothetical protein
MEPVYFVDGHAGELLCVEHAERFVKMLRDERAADEDSEPLSDEDLPSAVFNHDSAESVLYCGFVEDGHNFGHSFCGSCGSDVDGPEIHGPFARCWNCATESVFVDGIGFVFAGSGSGSWSDVLSCETVEVTSGIVPLMSTITDVLDISGTNPAAMRVFVGFHDLDPSLGLWLVLSDESWSATYESLVDELRERLSDQDDEPADEDEESDFRAGIRLVTLERPSDQLVFTTGKRNY